MSRMHRILVAKDTTARLTLTPEPELDDLLDLPGHLRLLKVSQFSSRVLPMTLRVSIGPHLGVPGDRLQID
jgi:hypothetical protein